MNIFFFPSTVSSASKKREFYRHGDAGGLKKTEYYNNRNERPSFNKSGQSHSHHPPPNGMELFLSHPIQS